jgi:hypothetical protein
MQLWGSRVMMHGTACGRPTTAFLWKRLQQKHTLCGPLGGKLNRHASFALARNQALDSAVLLGALSVSHVPLASDQQLIRERLHSHISQSLYQFAYSARRYIELAERSGIPMRESAERRGLVAIRWVGNQEMNDPAMTKDLWWVLGRIIHADSIDLEDREAIVSGSAYGERTANPWGFRVRSDKDPANQTWFIFLEFMIDRFLSIDRNFESDVLALLRREGVAT